MCALGPPQLAQSTLLLSPTHGHKPMWLAGPITASRKEDSPTLCELFSLHNTLATPAPEEPHLAMTLTAFTSLGELPSPHSEESIKGTSRSVFPNCACNLVTTCPLPSSHIQEEFHLKQWSPKGGSGSAGWHPCHPRTCD